MSDSSEAVLQRRAESDAPSGGEEVIYIVDDKKKKKKWTWMKKRQVLMSMAMFFMLICGGLLTSGMGPALPIIEKQLNMFVFHLSSHIHCTMTFIPCLWFDSSTTKSSYIFTGRYVGYLTGSCLFSSAFHIDG